jgi:hypothetical protein
MKNKLFKLGAIVSSFLLAVILVYSCSREELTQDLNLYVGNDFLVNPLTVQIADANDVNKIPTDAIITVDGPDKDKVFTLLGEKELIPVSGILGIAVKKSDTPSETNPLEFSLTISAPNYLTKTINFRLKNTEAQLADVELVNVNTPPAGLSIAENTFNTTAEAGVDKEIKFASPLSNGKTELSQIIIKPETKMLTKEGEVVDGAVESMLIHSNAKSIQSVSELPGWATAVKVQKTDGQLVENVIEPVGFFELSMHTDNAKVEKFSTPLESISYIDPNTYNPIEGRKIQFGDKLSVLSLSEGNDYWQEEGAAVVQQAANGKLKLTFNLTHLSHYTYGWSRIGCLVNLRVSSTITNWSGDSKCSVPLKNYFYKIVDANDANKVYASGWSHFGNGCYLEAGIFAQGKQVKVVIYAEKHSNTPLYSTGNITPCSSGIVMIPAGKLPVDNSVVVKVNVSALCKGANQGDVNAVFLPSASILFREMKQGTQWAHLVTLVPNNKTSTGCARGLVEGKTYDFAIAVNLNGKDELLTFSKTLKQPQGITVKPQTIKVRSEFWGYTKEAGFVEDFTITKDGNLYDLNFINCPTPQKVCSEVQNNFSAFVKKKK